MDEKTSAKVQKAERAGCGCSYWKVFSWHGMLAPSIAPKIGWMKSRFELRQLSDTVADPALQLPGVDRRVV